MLKEFLPNKNKNLEGLPDQEEILNTAVRLAREKKADFVLTGTVKAGENALQIAVNIIEAESSQVITFQDVYDEDIHAGTVGKLCRGLVLKLCDALPLVGGKHCQSKREKRYYYKSWS